MHYVIIGGGIAGTTAAEELRKRDAQAEITLVSEEQHPVYSRVLLPHYLKGKVPRERVFLKKETWYAEQNIEWLPGVRVEKIDVRNKFVAISEGREISYDKLLVATGGETRMIEGDPRGVSYLRTVDDTDHLLQLINEGGEGRHALVYGGGFISCEYLNAFAHHGIPASVAFRGPYFWSSIFDVETGTLVNNHLIANGVEVIPHATLLHLEGEDELRSVTLKAKDEERTIACALLGIGIGIEPDFSILKDVGIECGAGVRTNEFLETNVPDVYAAGDIAEFHDVTVGRNLMVGNWMNAQMQGRAVAANMVGERNAFKLVSSYATNVRGLEIIFVGDVGRAAAEEVKVIGSAAEGGVTQVFSRAGKVVGATIVGRNKDRAPLTKAIQEGKPFSEVF